MDKKISLLHFVWATGYFYCFEILSFTDFSKNNTNNSRGLFSFEYHKQMNEINISLFWRNWSFKIKNTEFYKS